MATLQLEDPPLTSLSSGLMCVISYGIKHRYEAQVSFLPAGMWARSSRRLALIVALVLHLSLHAQADALPGFSKNLFANVAPCAPLLRIIGERPNSTAPWGNFTEPPSELILQDCVDSSSYFVSDGEQLLFAVREEYPAVKVIRTQADTPLVLPNTTNMFIPGSVVVIDCQDNWLDFRKFPLEIEPIDAVAVYVRCHLLTSANNQASAIHTWTFSCSTHLPCDVCTLLSAVCMTLPGSPALCMAFPGLVFFGMVHMGKNHSCGFISRFNCSQTYQYEALSALPKRLEPYCHVVQASVTNVV